VLEPPVLIERLHPAHDRHGELVAVIGDKHNLRASASRGTSHNVPFLLHDRQLLAPSRWYSVTNMIDRSLLQRITANPATFGGKPIVRGLRISVELVMSLLAQGMTEQELLEDYPALQREDIQACLVYAHAVIANDSFDVIKVG